VINRGSGLSCLAISRGYSKLFIRQFRASRGRIGRLEFCVPTLSLPSLARQLRQPIGRRGVLMSGGRRLLDQVRDVSRIKHYSIRTEQAYLQWIRRYILFHGKRHPSELGSEHLGAFLSHLAVRGNVAASTQNQALNAILFLYRHVLKQNLPGSKAFSARSDRSTCRWC
jgi:hypothetical protein